MWRSGIVVAACIVAVGQGSSMATVWSDDFSSGNALAVSYNTVVDAETNATCGQAGGWGVRTTGTASQKYNGAFLYTPGSPIASEYLRVSLDVDHVFAGDSGSGASLFELRGASIGWFVSLYHGLGAGADRSVLAAYSRSESTITPVGSSAIGVITPASWQTVVLEVWFSTDAGGGAPASDGRIKVSVDGMSAIDATGIRVQSIHGLPNETAKVYVGPMGNGDNLTIDDAPPETWMPVADFTEKRLDAAQYPGGVARVVCDLWAPGDDAHPPPINLTARLVSLLTTRDVHGLFEVDVEVGRSATIASAVPADGSFTVTLAGIKRHRLEVTSPTTETDLWCAPGAEVSP